MPWSIGDVDSHKKGLSDKQKKQWVRIANSVLAKCMKDGGKEEDCAASAIKQANGVVGNNSSNERYSAYVNKQEGDYEVEIKLYEKKPYLVVPVTMIVEGVLNGSHGPLLHLAEDFGKFPGSWDGIPIVIDHPEKNGQGIPANDPEILDMCSVGKVFGTKVEGKKLVAKAWFDEEKLNEVNPKILEEINSNKVLEVSVGVFSEEEEEDGDYEGVHYDAIARNHRPDHLAILTEEVGACSCEDGCGLGVNAKRPFIEMVKSIRKSGYAVSSIGDNKKAGYREKMDAVYAALRGMDSDDSYHYLEEMYDAELIYSKSSKGGTKMYKQEYTFESGKVELSGNPVEVHRKVEYSTNQVNNNSKKEVKMADECKPCIKTKVDALIANEKGRWKEDDRAFLQGLSEEQLDKMAPIEVEKVVEKTVTVNALSEDDKVALATYKAQLKEKREQMVRDIQANSSKELWPDETLKGMNDDTLKRVFDSVKKPDVVDYSVFGETPIQQNAAGEDDLLLPTGMNFETKK